MACSGHHDRSGASSYPIRAPGSLIFLALTLVTLAACTSCSQQRTFLAKPGEPDHSPALTGPFPTAETWIESLNQQGVPCRFQRNRHRITLSSSIRIQGLVSSIAATH